MGAKIPVLSPPTIALAFEAYVEATKPNIH